VVEKRGNAFRERLLDESSGVRLVIGLGKLLLLFGKKEPYSWKLTSAPQHDAVLRYCQVKNKKMSLAHDMSGPVSK
jgi:hypothetical protein